MPKEEPKVLKREVVDWEGLQGFMEGLKEKDKEEERRIFEGTEGETAYDKILYLRRRFIKTQRIYGRSKKWWDAELGEQLKAVRKAGRGGKGRGARDHDPSRWMRWKKEKAKMKVMVQKKKEKCWRKFTEEYGEKDHWEVARLARDP